MEPGGSLVDVHAEPFEEAEPVGQAGEAVVRGGPLHLLGGLTLLGDVLDVGDGERVALVGHDRHPRACPHGGTVAAQEPLLGAIPLGALQHRFFQQLSAAIAFLRVGDVVDVAADELVAGAAQHVDQRVVDVDERAVGDRDERHAGGGVVEREAEPFAGTLEAVCLGDPLGDVAQGHDHAVGVEDGHVRIGLEQHLAAVGAVERERGRGE